MHRLWWGKTGQNYFFTKVWAPGDMRVNLRMGYDGPFRVWVDGKEVFQDLHGAPPASADMAVRAVALRKGQHAITVAMDINEGRAWGFMLRFGRQDARGKQARNGALVLPVVLRV